LQLNVAAARIEKLVVIGDTVYMACREPYLEIRTARRDSKNVMLLGWTTEDEKEVRSNDMRRAFDLHAHPTKGYVPAEETKKYPTKWGSPPKYVFTFDISGTASAAGRFPLDREDDARKMMSLLASYAGAEIDDIERDCVDYVDPTLLTREPEIVSIFEAVKKSFDRGVASDEWKSLLDEKDETVIEWLAARSMVANATLECGMEKAMNAATTVMERIDSAKVRKAMNRSNAGFVALTRWECCDRTRDHVSDLARSGKTSLDDDEAAAIASM
jgi:hypothetical protein